MTAIASCPPSLALPLRLLLEVALDYMPPGQADALVRNVVTALSLGAGLACVDRAVQHRRRLGWIEMSDEAARCLVEGLERAWAKGTREGR